MRAGLLSQFALTTHWLALAAHGFVAWFPCSAKTGENVEMAFSALTSHVMGCIDLWVHEDWTLESVFLKNCACA